MYSWEEIQVGTNDGSNDCDDLHLDSPQVDSVIKREEGALEIKITFSRKRIHCFYIVL